MTRAAGPVRAWIGSMALVAVVLIGLNIRVAPPSEAASASASAPEGLDLAPGRGGQQPGAELETPMRNPVPGPTPTAVPTRPPTPAPTPMPPTPAAVAPQPTPINGGAGGGLAPRSAPPGWTPPASMPGDIWTKGRFGQTLANGGISVSVSRLPSDVTSASCTDHNELPAGMSWIGFSVRVSWSGFPIPVYGADVAGQGLVTCWIGDPAPLTSGVTYQVFKQVPTGSTPAWLRVGLFPNGASPAYVFEFS